jgi:hypothetical protein
MANQELNAKREQVAYLTKRANHKISRLRRSADVEVAGSQYDVRKPKAVVNRLTSRQLDAQIARLSQFNDRSTQFVGDIKKRPIPASEWRDYKRAETTFAKHMDAQYSKIKDLVLPGQEGSKGYETIDQRRARSVSDRRLAGNPTVQDPFGPPVRLPGTITSRQALKALTKDLKNKNRPGWDNKELARQIGEAKQILDRIGDKTLADKVAKMTAQQFSTLWNATPFSGALGTEYEQVMAMLKGDNHDYDEKLVADAFQDAHRFADWATTIKFEGDNKIVAKVRVPERKPTRNRKRKQ